MSSLKEKILFGINEYEQRMKKLLEGGPMLRGSVGRVFTRCGKPTCWCAKSPQGHPHTRMTWSQEGQMVTRKVPAEAIQQILELTHQYRRFRSDRRTLLALQIKLQNLLDRYEETLTHQARRWFPGLRIISKMSRRSKKTRAKR
jgi:hypothetical protein